MFIGVYLFFYTWKIIIFLLIGLKTEDHYIYVYFYDIFVCWCNVRLKGPGPTLSSWSLMDCYGFVSSGCCWAGGSYVTVMDCSMLPSSALMTDSLVKGKWKRALAESLFTDRNHKTQISASHRCGRMQWHTHTHTRSLWFWYCILLLVSRSLTGCFTSLHLTAASFVSSAHSSFSFSFLKWSVNSEHASMH